MKVRFFLKCLSAIFVVIYLVSCNDTATDSFNPSSDEFSLVDFDPAWSSGADKIAYVHSNIDHKLTGIYVMNSDGTGLAKAVSDFARSPGWSPDNQWIVFSQFDNIYKIKLNTDSIVQLTFSTRNAFPKWSSDNIRIAFSNCSGANGCVIQTMKPDGTEIKTIDENANYPEWVNGSSSLIYFKPSYVNGTLNGDTLTRYFFTDSSKQNITFLGGDDHKVNMFPVYEGDEIVFCSMNNTGSIYIYRMGLDGSNIVQLTTTQGYSPDYSFANQKIIYTNRNKGNGRLWMMNKDGSNKTQVTF